MIENNLTQVYFKYFRLFLHIAKYDFEQKKKKSRSFNVILLLLHSSLLIVKGQEVPSSFFFLSQTCQKERTKETASTITVSSWINTSSLNYVMRTFREFIPILQIETRNELLSKKMK